MTTASIRTRGGILEAARREFASHGLAGGRVDRIAKLAGANVQRIYAYYTDKQGLFDAVVWDATEDLAAALSPSPSDIVAFADAVFDYIRANPNNTRIMTWARLEQEEECSRMDRVDLTGASPASLVARLQDAGVVTDQWDATVIFESIIAIAEQSDSTHLAPGVAEVKHRKELVLHFARSLATPPTAV